MNFRNAEKCEYPVRHSWKYMNTNCNNTFIFDDNDKIVKLYYQPVIYDSDRSHVNGVGLYRNNTISLNSDGEIGGNGHYYVPDYLVKVESLGKTKYVIIDAKFSSIKTVKRYYVSQLAYKYLFSLSTALEEEQISGLCIIYGKCDEENRPQTIYNKQLTNTTISPFAELLPMIEGVDNGGFFSNINDVFTKM